MMKAADPAQLLLERLRALEDLNPDIPAPRRGELLRLARDCAPGAFPTLAQEVERLIALYLDTPTSHVGRAILAEYFEAIEHSAAHLLECGEIHAPGGRGGEPAAPSQTISNALVLYSASEYSALDRCKILNRAEIPPPLSNAADSFRRRIEVVETVFGIGFELLAALDLRQFQLWAADYLDAHKGDLDPVLIRDLLQILRDAPEQIQPRLREWLFTWCADTALLEHWPLVVRFSDRLLARIALAAWVKGARRPGNSPLAHLRLLVANGHDDDSHLLPWLETTLQNFGEGVERFISLDLEDNPDEEAWRHAALVAELRNLAATCTPILVVADQLLTEPDGAVKLAMAFLGIVGQGLADWERRVRLLSEKLIRRAFLYDLKAGRTPVETIRKFTFGDEVAFGLICNELDLVSQQFDSIAQREVVVRRLAVFYASFRRAPMLGVEVAKRYKHLARILHDDFLNAHLAPAELDEFRRGGFLQNLYSLGSLAKRFLDHRRALEMSLEEMLASELEFVAEIRARRLQAIRLVLGQSAPA